MTVLDRIVEDTRVLLRDRKAKVPVGRLEEEHSFDRTPLQLVDALRSDRFSIISEIKKASPSKGVIRSEFHPVEIAAAYERAGAAAISVLTEPLHFQGSLEDLAAVRREAAVPLLRKDFLVDVYQLFEARAFGADAVLLIAAVLDRVHLHDMVQAARELGLSVLVEVYELGELDKIDFDEVSILGVNNRDLRTFEVDIDNSLRVFAHVPAGVIRVSESGITAAEELRHLRDNGADAVLIGESLMRADDPGHALSRLCEQLEALADR